MRQVNSIKSISTPQRSKGCDGKLFKSCKAPSNKGRRWKESQFLRRQGMPDPNRAAAAPESGAETITDLPTQPSSAPAPVRRKPKISETPPPPPPIPKLADYEAIIGKSQLEELRFVAQPLQGKRVKMVNSTAVGGGVAEMLNRLVPLLDELGVKTGWEVITGGNDFFEVTKGFHNALHGAPLTLTQQARDVFMLHTEQNRQRMNFGEDFIVIHDPQPVG